MKKLTRKVLIFGLLLGSMSIVACGGGNGGNGGNNSSDGSQTSTSAKTKGPWTVKFDTNGGNETYPDQIVQHEGLVTDPGTPTRTDPVRGTYTFVEWRSSDGSVWSFKGSKVKKDITIVARWVEKYEVSYQDADGQPIGTVSYVDNGSALTKPADPTAPSGKVFYGWMNVKNGGQIWNYSDATLNKVMEDVSFKPLFVDASLQAQPFEAECCPDFTDDSWGPKGMPGATYSGGQNGTGLVGKDFYVDGKNKYETSGYFEVGESKLAGYAHFLYAKGDTLTWELESSEAATNVTMFMRLSAEYGLVDPLTDEVYSSFDDTMFTVSVNGTALKYGSVTLHNIVPMFLITFQDYFVSASVSLQKGTNIIQMKVDNTVTLNGTIASTAPVVDCIKLYSSSTLTWPKETVSNLTAAMDNPEDQ